MKVKNMISDRGNTIANQFIITNSNSIVFQSYESTIVSIDHDKKVICIYPDYNYSKTTGKYRNIFFRDYGFNELSNINGLEKAIDAGYCKDYIVKKIV